jgi:hypothetical protein
MTMDRKSLSRIAAAFAAMMLVLSCGGKEEKKTEQDTLTVSPASLEFTSEDV